jgi:thiosulfate dehydrogenase
LARALGRFVVLLFSATVAFGPSAFAQKPLKSAPRDWPQPDAFKLPAGPWRDTVLYGRKLIVETHALVGPEVPNKIMRYAGNNLACQSCHLNAGMQQFGLPLIGVYGVFPAYMGRENQVRTLEERINGCFERSMNGHSLPVGGKEMKALVAYIQFLSTGIPIGTSLKGRGTPALPLLARAADPKHGAQVYNSNCALCHQTDGQGQRNGVRGDAKGYLYPPLWGQDSFNDGAGMHRLIASASFIHANMPFGTTYQAPKLSIDDAWDAAGYINSRPRPKRAHLNLDYPDRSRKPVDATFVPFTDKFPLEQHRLGPYQPMLDAQKKR